MTNKVNPSNQFIKAISQSGLTIYDPIEIGDPTLWIPSPELEIILNQSLNNISLAGLPLRTRSKTLKEQVCLSLGYPIPKSFKKTRPRFIGQLFDTYIQKSNNLQIWNEDLAPTRRYVIIKLSAIDIVERVKVVTGDTLSLLDSTGTLTNKYQAKLVLSSESSELISAEDTSILKPLVSNIANLDKSDSPTDYPQIGKLMSIQTIFQKLKSLVGMQFIDSGYDQERNRGASLHRLVCQHLGYANYKDDGRFPDIRHQLIEIKLQTSPTIDLGIACPSSYDVLDIPQIFGNQLRHCDVRYVIFFAKTDGYQVTLTNFYLTNGSQFFYRFPQFQGQIVNKKIQIQLPKNFFA